MSVLIEFGCKRKNKFEIDNIAKIKIIPLEEAKKEIQSLGLCGRWSGINTDVNTHYINKNITTNDSNKLANYYK